MTLERPPLQIEILDTANALVELAGLLSWGWSPVAQNHAPVRARPGRMVVPRWDPSGFKVTMSLWHEVALESEDR